MSFGNSNKLNSIVSQAEGGRRNVYLKLIPRLVP